jgi:hypothetical protein
VFPGETIRQRENQGRENEEGMQRPDFRQCPTWGGEMASSSCIGEFWIKSPASESSDLKAKTQDFTHLHIPDHLSRITQEEANSQLLVFLCF